MKSLNIEELLLRVGSHEPNDNEMCVMEAVAFVAGEPWSDSPKCASPVIAAFLRSYKDSVDDTVRQSLKQYIPRLVGSRGSEALEERRSLIAADWLVAAVKAAETEVLAQFETDLKSKGIPYESEAVPRAA